MTLEILREEFSIFKVASDTAFPERGIVFTAITDRERSVVCESAYAPAEYLAREDGWRAFRVCGQLDFQLVGILSRIAGTLAEAEISVFCVSTFDTDYVLVRSERLTAAIDALQAKGYRFSD